ncbi:Streptococcal surface protein B [Labeo rohita]|uniref:Streptococcal surface protein B n=1 Tax=Labeo rohita TaxID=84645 RepID=A0ABQ8LH54_LABRO|nr:Streptococcal surface protein B [Labeo rohita]
MDTVDFTDSNLDFFADVPILLPPASELSVCAEFSGCPVVLKEAISELFVSPQLSCHNHRGHSSIRCAPGEGSCSLLFVGSTHLRTLPLLPSPIITTSSALPFSAPLFPGSPSAHPQPTISALGSLRVCQSSLASWLEDPLSLPPASESHTPPRPINPAAPPWFPAPSSPPWPVSPPAPSGSIRLPRPSDSSLVSRRPSAASGLYSTPSVGSTMGHLHGCRLGPSASSCSKSLLSPSWLLLFPPLFLPPSSLPWTSSSFA